MIQDPKQKASLRVVFLTVFIDLLGFGMVIPLLPIYAKQFTVDESGWVIGALMASFSAMQFLFAPLWGRLSDSVGRRPVLMFGLAGSTVFYAVFGLATASESLTWMFVSRIGAGVCGATISTAQAYIADVTTLADRTKGMALIGAAFGLGFTFGPLIGAAALLGSSDVGLSPWPGYAAAILSGGAFLLASVRLRESLHPGTAPAEAKWFDFRALGDALAAPSIGVLLLALFVCVFSFANFESTMSLLLKQPEGGFAFEFKEVLLVFAFVGLVLTFVQGFLVRRVAGRLPEAVLATGGAIVSIVGFLLLAAASGLSNFSLLIAALAIEVTGFAFMSPSIQSLISRRTDPAKQGRILGVGQSMSAMARIFGPLVGIRLFHVQATLPFVAAAGLMLLGLILVTAGAWGGRDFEAAA